MLHPPNGFFVMLPEEILSCWPFKIKMFGNVIILYFKMVPNLGTNHKNTFVQQIVIYSHGQTAQHKYTNDSENNCSFKFVW